MHSPCDFQLDPRLEQDSHFFQNWPLCQLRLMDDQQYPWFVLIPRRAGLRELVDLSEQDAVQYQLESRQLSLWMRQQFQPVKLNIAALGNIVPQLHIHHIARFTDDKAWPAPIWGCVPMLPYTEQQLQQKLFHWQQSLPVWPEAL
ncbi:MAG: HIT domain-containing protein [Alkalimonas sp.]|nr:HIT domain-containing protein [Alkalimonas sp.]